MDIQFSKALTSFGLFVAKVFAYIVAVVIFVHPVTNPAGMVAAIVAVPVGVMIAEAAVRFRVRGGLLALAALVAIGFGIYSDAILGSSAGLSRILGVSKILSLISITTCGCLVLGVVLLLRYVGSRYSAGVALEAMAIVAVVVFSFIGHRETNIGQPREFADWAFGAGHDPRLILRVIGASMAAAILMLLLRGVKTRQILASMLILAILTSSLYGVSFRLLPDRPQTVKKPDVPKDDESGKNGRPTPPPPQPGPSNDQNGSGKPTPPGQNDKFGDKIGNSRPKPDHGDGQQDRDTPSFDPHDWPNRPKPMAIVSLEDDFRSAPGALYFRQMVYSQYNGERLVRAVTGGIDADVPRDFPVSPTTFPLLPPVKKLHKTVPMVISLIREHARPFGMTNVLKLDALPNRNPDEFIRSYSCESQVLAIPVGDDSLMFLKAGDPQWTKEIRDGYLQGPQDLRYKALADEILSKIDWKKFNQGVRNSATLKAFTIRRWIEQNMVYSLEADHTQAKDPVASFLFGDRRGYCVHVAHAMTYLLRSAGIPARTACGYMVESGRAGQGEGMLMLCTDMHAWCEVYLEGLGWTVMDASLEKSESAPPPRVDTAVQNFFAQKNRMEFEQKKIVESEKPSLPNFPLLPLALGMPLLIVGLYSVKFWRAMAPRFAAAEQLYRVCYRAAADRLSECGQIRQFGETREEFGERIAKWNPDFRTMTHAHVRRSTTGSDTLSQAEWRAVLLRTLEKIRTVLPRKSRMLGLIRPLTWLRTR